MKILINGIYDSKVKMFSTQLVPSRTIEEAIRGFKGACENKDTDFAKYPEDFTLHLLGEFDQLTGDFVQKDKMIISKASDFSQQ